MPLVDTVRTISRQTEVREHVAHAPEFKVGDYVEKIYSGLNCTVKGVRFNHDTGKYEYLDGNIMSDGWVSENLIQRAYR